MAWATDMTSYLPHLPAYCTPDGDGGGGGSCAGSGGAGGGGGGGGVDWTPSLRALSLRSTVSDCLTRPAAFLD